MELLWDIILYLNKEGQKRGKWKTRKIFNRRGNGTSLVFSVKIKTRNPVRIIITIMITNLNVTSNKGRWYLLANACLLRRAPKGYVE